MTSEIHTQILARRWDEGMKCDNKSKHRHPSLPRFFSSFCQRPVLRWHFVLFVKIRLRFVYNFITPNGRHNQKRYHRCVYSHLSSWSVVVVETPPKWSEEEWKNHTHTQIHNCNSYISILKTIHNPLTNEWMSSMRPNERDMDTYCICECAVCTRRNATFHNSMCDTFLFKGQFNILNHPILWCADVSAGESAHDSDNPNATLQTAIMMTMIYSNMHCERNNNNNRTPHTHRTTPQRHTALMHRQNHGQNTSTRLHTISFDPQHWQRPEHISYHQTTYFKHTF